LVSEWVLEKTLNNLILIHPFILIMYIVYYTHTNFLSFKKNLFFIQKYKTLIEFLYLINTILIGGWWAAQEVNWGGVWNWDPVELCLIFIFLKVLINLHFNNRKCLKYTLISIYVYIYLFLFINRNSIVKSIHNFNAFLFADYKIMVLIIFAIVITIKVTIYLKNGLFLKKINHFFKKKNSFWISNLIFKILIVFYLNTVLIYNSKFIDLTHHYLYIGLFLKFTLSLLFLSWCVEKNCFFIITVNLYNFYNSLMLIIFNVLLGKKYIRVIHTCILIILYIYINSIYLSYISITLKYKIQWIFVSKYTSVCYEYFTTNSQFFLEGVKNSNYNFIYSSVCKLIELNSIKVDEFYISLKNNFVNFFIIVSAGSTLILKELKNLYNKQFLKNGTLQISKKIFQLFR